MPTANFYTVNNYAVPPSGQRMSAQYVCNALDLGHGININPPSGAPVTNSWQTMIVDARKMTVPVNIALGTGGCFDIDVLPGTYASFDIPAYTQPIFYLSNTLGGNWTSGTVKIIFQNYPTLPQEYGLNSLYNAQVALISPGSDNVAITGGPFRKVDYTILNISGASVVFNLIFTLISGNQFVYPIVIANDVTIAYSVWMSDDVGLGVNGANTNLFVLPSGVFIYINLGT